MVDVISNTMFSFLRLNYNYGEYHTKKVNNVMFGDAYCANIITARVNLKIGYHITLIPLFPIVLY